MPATADLSNLEVWGHKHPNLLNVGRCSHKAPLGMDDEAVDGYMEKMGEEDKVEERYRAIQEDAPYPGLEAAWLSKVVGDSQ